MAGGKAEPAFVPQTELEKYVHGGNDAAAIEYLAHLSEGERKAQAASFRRMHKLMEKAYFTYEASPTAWRRTPTDRQWLAIAAAAFACGTAEDIAQVAWHFSRRHEALIALWGRFPPQDTAHLGDMMLAHRARFELVQALFTAGLIERPTSDNYPMALLAFSARNMRGPLQKAVAEDPGLAHGPMLRLFEIEGTQDNSLSGQDKYGYGIGGVPEGATTWQSLYLDLCKQGVYTRQLLLDKTLGALEQGWIQFRSGWFSRFHDALAPTPQEMAPHAARYLGLCLSRIPPTVTLAVKSLAALSAQRLMEGRAVLGAMQPVLASGIKGQVDAALKLLDDVVKRQPALAGEAACAVIPALNHEAPEVHKKVIARLKAWGMSEEARQLAAPLLPHVSASSRPALAALLGEAQAEQPAAPARAQQEAELPAFTGPRSPLEEDRRIAPITGLDELVERAAYVLENETDVDEFERVADALVRMAPYSDEAKKRFAPVRKRAHKLKPDPKDHWNDEKALAGEMARLLVFLLDDERQAATRAYTMDNATVYSGYAGAIDLSKLAGPRKFTAHSFLCERIDDLMDLAAQGKSVPPLSSPTHRRGFIEAGTLVARAAAHLAAGVRNALQEEVLSLLRLAHGADEAVRKQARALPETPYTRALRYALGDDIEPAQERELFFAAGRVRHPNADDPELVARFGDCGPDGPRAARYAFHVDVSESGDYTFYHGRLEIVPAPRAIDPGYLAIMMHPQPESGSHYLGYDRFGTSEESLIPLSATLLPSCLESFFAEGVHALSNNLDWSAAEWQNKAYLERLLDPTVPLTSMAALALACGLAGKDPGQTALAQDALVASWLERRLDVPALARALRELLKTPLAKAPRFAKSLGAAARAHSLAPRLVYELLCAMVMQDALDPPKNIAALFELLLELKLELGDALPAATQGALEVMKVTGKGKALQKALLPLREQCTQKIVRPRRLSRSLGHEGDLMESDKTILALGDKRWLSLRMSPLMFISIFLAVTVLPIVYIIFPDTPTDQLLAKLPDLLAKIDWVRAAPNLVMLCVVFGQILYVTRAQRLERLTLSPDGIQYTSPLPSMLKQLKPDWFLPWHQVKKAELGIIGARLVNETQARLTLSSSSGKRHIFPALWVDPGNYSRPATQFKFTITSTTPPQDEILNSVMSSEVLHYISRNVPNLSVDSTLDKAEVFVSLERNLHGRIAIGLIFSLLAYAFFDAILGPESYIDEPASLLYVYIPAGVIAAILSGAWLYRSALPIAERIGLAALIGVVASFAMIPGALRINALTDFNRADTYDYVVAQGADGIVLRSVVTGMPDIDYFAKNKFWGKFDKNATYPVQVHKGLLGFYQFNSSAIADDIHKHESD